MNPTSPPLLHERRFCLSLFISQVIVVLVCALFLYFTLIVPSRDANTASETGISEFNYTEPGSALTSTDDFPSPVSASEEVGEVSECIFIPSKKLPNCINESKSWNNASCRLLIKLSCNGTDYQLEEDEDTAATVYCPSSEDSHFELILHLERGNEIFACAFIEEDSNGSQCRNDADATDSNFCPGLLLSCTCGNSNLTATMKLLVSETTESVARQDVSWSNFPSNVMRSDGSVLAITKESSPDSKSQSGQFITKSNAEESETIDAAESEFE